MRPSAACPQTELFKVISPGSQLLDLLIPLPQPREAAQFHAVIFMILACPSPALIFLYCQEHSQSL